jgi:hypothetical protein
MAVEYLACRIFRERWSKSALSVGFRKWRAASIKLKQRRLRWQQMERRSLEDLKAQVFYAWCLVRQERLDGKEAVRRCVAGKRIAFQAFQKWFGNNLEEPVCSVCAPAILKTPCCNSLWVHTGSACGSLRIRLRCCVDLVGAKMRKGSQVEYAERSRLPYMY